MNRFQKFSFAAAIVASALAGAMPAYADCRGFFCNVVKDIPIVGTAAQGGDEYIAALKERGSSADVLNQGTTLNTWNNPIGQPAGARAPPPPAYAMGNRCATPVGVLAYTPPPPPIAVGTNCVWYAPNGYAYQGSVVQ